MVINKKTPILFSFLFFLSSFVFGLSVNLNQQDIFVRKGFDKNWIHSVPTATDDWLHILGNDGGRPLIVRNLELGDIPKHRFLFFDSQPAQSFTFITSFHVSQEALLTLPPTSLFLKGIAYNWEIYLNGTSIEKEIYFNSDSTIVPRRGKRLHVLIPTNLIHVGENVLTYHIIGDPTFFGTGFYFSGPYTIGPTKNYLKTPFKVFSMAHFAFYMVITIVGVFLYFRRLQSPIYFQFSLLTFSFAVYNAIRAYFEMNSGSFGFLSFRIEYIAIFINALLFPLIINLYLKNKITFLIKVYCGLCALFIFLSSWANPNIMFDILRVWQFILPAMSAYVLYIALGSFVANRRHQYSNKPFPEDWVRFPIMEISLICVGTFVLLLSVLLEAADSLFWKQAIHFSQWGFLICSIILSGILFNRFINAGIKVEEWSEKMETEVNKRTKELQKVKDDMEAVFKTSGDGIARLSLGLELETYNDAFRKMFGFSREELIGIKLDSFCDEENIQIILDNRQKIFRDEVAIFRVRSRRKKGSPIDLSVTCSLLKDLKNRPSGIIVNIKNITKEVTFENELRLSKENLEAVFTALPDLYFRFNADGKYLDFKGPKTSVYKPNQDIIGDTVSDRLPTDIAEKVMDAIAKAMKKQTKVMIEYELDIRGEMKTFESAILPFRGNEVIAGVRDITERRLAEKSLYESEKQHRTLVENMEDLVFVVDVNQNILFVNQSLLIFLGKKNQDILGKNITTILKEKSYPIIGDTIEHILATARGEKADVEITFGAFSGWFEITFIPQQDKDGTIISLLCIGHETTDRKLYETYLRNHVNQLRHQRKQLEDLSKKSFHIQEEERRFIGLELHDEIGQAMTAISMSLEGIRKTPGEDAIQEQLKRCQKLVEETSEKIHRFSSDLRPPALDVLGFVPAIKSHSKTFNDQTGIVVNFDGDDTGDNLNDEQKISFYRVFQESLNNIAKHSKAKEVNVLLNKENGRISMLIEDNGKGFAPLKSADSTTKNLGLGLVGMRERIQSIGGTFSVHSAPGKGTRLAITVPIKE